MAITAEQVQAAFATMKDVQQRVFFNKLASLGVNPASDEERAMLWELGSRVLLNAPSRSQEAQTIKQASFNVFGDKISAVDAHGYSQEAYATVDELFKDERVVKSAHILLAVNNA